MDYEFDTQYSISRHFSINYFKIYLFKICNRDEMDNEWFGIIFLFIITYLNGF